MKKEKFKMVSAVHLFFIRENKILLLRRYNTGYQDGMFSVVAGHLDGGEFVTSAASREAKEEADLTILEDDIDVIGIMHRFSDDERIDFFVNVRKWEGEIKNMEPDKCDLLEWFDIDDLPENIIPYIKRAINNFKNSVHFDEFNENE